MSDSDRSANSFGVFQGYYEEHYLSSYSSSEIAWIGGIQQFLLFFSVKAKINSKLTVGTARWKTVRCAWCGGPPLAWCGDHNTEPHAHFSYVPD